MAVIEEAPIGGVMAAATPPIVTVASGSKLAPNTTAVVPPAVGPELGDIPVTVRLVEPSKTFTI